MCEKNRIAIMIAGVAGASLGTEISKSLQLANDYAIYGCDISPLAYGLYENHFIDTFLIDECAYISSVIDACKKANTKILLAGGERPMFLLSQARNELENNGITLISNSHRIIEICSNKVKLFQILADIRIETPKSIEGNSKYEIATICAPYIVKPSEGSGGSNMVFFAASVDEAFIYCEYIKKSGTQPLVQEYISEQEGEFTVGILSYPDGEIAGSIVLQRSFNSKLSVLMKSKNGLISSGYSQGFIGAFYEIRKQCEEIALKLKSTGPLNIQGRMKNGQFLPFEINPRFSASTYLRSIAGFNEVDTYIKHHINGEKKSLKTIKEGWYLRSFCEIFIPPDEIKQL